MVAPAQSNAPSSPEAAKKLWPCAAACWKTLSSAVISAAVVLGSQTPQLVEFDGVVSLVTIAL